MAKQTLKAMDIAKRLHIGTKGFFGADKIEDLTRIALRTTGGPSGVATLGRFLEYTKAVPLTIIGYAHDAKGIVPGKTYNWLFFDRDFLSKLEIEADDTDEVLFPPEPPMPALIPFEGKGSPHGTDHVDAEASAMEDIHEIIGADEIGLGEFNGMLLKYIEGNSQLADFRDFMTETLNPDKGDEDEDGDDEDSEEDGEEDSEEDSSNEWGGV